MHIMIVQLQLNHMLLINAHGYAGSQHAYDLKDCEELITRDCNECTKQ